MRKNREEMLYSIGAINSNGNKGKNKKQLEKRPLYANFYSQKTSDLLNKRNNKKYTKKMQSPVCRPETHKTNMENRTTHLPNKQATTEEQQWVKSRRQKKQIICDRIQMNVTFGNVCPCKTQKEAKSTRRKYERGGVREEKHRPNDSRMIHVLCKLSQFCIKPVQTKCTQRRTRIKVAVIATHAHELLSLGSLLSRATQKLRSFNKRGSEAEKGPPGLIIIYLNLL